MHALPDVAVIGAAILDVVVPGAGPRVFETGSLPCPGLRLSTGGDAMNEAVALSRLGRRARLVSRVGNDAAGDLVLGVCAKNGIDVSAVVRADVATGVNVVLVGEGGERSFLTDPQGSLRKIAPVSYTHLDVYKRQAPGGVEVVDAVRKGVVHHGKRRRLVDLRVVSIRHGQAHAAKAEGGELHILKIPVDHGNTSLFAASKAQYTRGDL